MNPNVLALVAGCVGFAGFLCFAPTLLIRAIYGPVTDPEHIAALRYGSEPGREGERSQATDMRANRIGIGTTGEIFTHLGGRI